MNLGWLASFFKGPFLNLFNVLVDVAAAQEKQNLEKKLATQPEAKAAAQQAVDNLATSLKQSANQQLGKGSN